MSEALAAHYEAAIENALKARDIPAVGVLLSALAVVDPDRAQVVFDTLRLAVDLMRPPGLKEEANE